MSGTNNNCGSFAGGKEFKEYQILRKVNYPEDIKCLNLEELNILQIKA